MLNFTLNNFFLYRKALPIAVLVFWVAGASNFALAADAESDRIDLEQLEIQGANELPKVLYIVPWKRTEVDDSPVAVDSMIDEIMVPIDRDVLHRQIEYYKQGVFGQ